MIDIVSATRLSKDEFWDKSALGLSLSRFAGDSRLSNRIAFSNDRGLPERYNFCINAEDSAEILVFVHDDVWLDDFYFADRVIEGLRHYDVIGVAGNRRRVTQQRAWLYAGADFYWDVPNLSGAVAHGPSFFGSVTFFGPTPADCELLDGVLIAAKVSTLREHGLTFDPRFKFHFYDMDFCRSARKKGLRLGTWPIALTHQSAGSFGSESWQAGHRAYLEKWGD